MKKIDLNNTKVRIDNISINNIKNVLNGSVTLDVSGKDTFGASIVGLYGQNGSGKTALIWAFELLKDAFSGAPLPNDTYYYIHQKSDEAKISIEFKIVLNEKHYNVFYNIKLRKLSNKNFCIHSESLEYSSKGDDENEKIKKKKIIEISLSNDNVENLFNYGPDNRISEMMAKDKQVKQKLSIIQALAKDKNISFIFNDKMRELLNFAYDNEFSNIIEQLCFYGRMNLFVLNKNSETSFNMNLLPLSLRLSSSESITKSDMFPIGLGQNTADEKTYKLLKKIIAQIDMLLQSIIPGLNVDMEEVVQQLDQQGKKQIVFELVSKRNGIPTPLRYESEGIKKILCILSSLISMYNNSSIFVAIDEMDAGIFEYLLGEFLDVINKTGKGQLLFTSHNMRPLEVLNNSNIYFTTTNPDNKYIKFTGIKESNNLRTTLLRTIDLGGQKESVYESTSSYQIGKAFRKAGEFNNANK